MRIGFEMSRVFVVKCEKNRENSTLPNAKKNRMIRWWRIPSSPTAALFTFTLCGKGFIYKKNMFHSGTPGCGGEKVWYDRSILDQCLRMFIGLDEKKQSVRRRLPA